MAQKRKSEEKLVVNGFPLLSFLFMVASSIVTCIYVIIRSIRGMR